TRIDPGKAGLKLLALVCLFAAGCATTPPQTQVGLASWHGPSMFSSESQTSSGRKWWPWSMVAAHRTLPLGTVILVTNLENHRRVKVTIIDHGPYAGDRILDLSKKAAGKLRMLGEGEARVKIEVLKTP